MKRGPNLLEDLDPLGALFARGFGPGVPVLGGGGGGGKYVRTPVPFKWESHLVPPASPHPLPPPLLGLSYTYLPFIFVPENFHRNFFLIKEMRRAICSNNLDIRLVQLKK